MRRIRYSRERLIRDAILRWAYEAYARPRERMAEVLMDGLHRGDLQVIRKHFAEFMRSAPKAPQYDPGRDPSQQVGAQIWNITDGRLMEWTGRGWIRARS